MEYLEIKVNGIVCSGCENRICNVIKDINGIISVTASHKTNLVQIKFNKDVNINEIYEKIENLGFEVIKEKA